MKFVLPDKSVELYAKLNPSTVSQALPIVFRHVMFGDAIMEDTLDDGVRMAVDFAVAEISKRTKRIARQKRYEASVAASEMTQETNKGKEGEEKFPPYPLYKEEGESQTKKEHTQTLSFSDEAKLFGMFWDAYPKKVGKAYAEQCFHNKVKMSGDAVALVNRMCHALSIQSKSFDWTKQNGQYIPNPSTWLNQERWEDVPMESKQNKMDAIASQLAKGLIQ